MRAFVASALLAAPLVAQAQPADPLDPVPMPTTDVGGGSGSDEDVPDTSEDAQRQIDDLTARLEQLEERHEALREDVSTSKWLRRYITVVVDVGAFAVAGDGSGIRPDIGHLYYPEDAGHVRGDWSFMGDPLATMVNALGEPADTSTSREITDDTIHSHGHASMIVNSIGIAIGKDVGHHLAISSLVNLLPRPRENILDIELAEIVYRPLPEYNWVIEAGKVDSVLGVEYRDQDALKRLTVTPSLICRYTCGRPLGVRSRLDRGRLSVSASITNGDNFVDRFEPDTSLKPNWLPTFAGHVQWKLPVGQGLELGISGAVGPQDGQSQLSTEQWHLGFDAKLTDWHGFDAVAEWVDGKQPGRTMTVPCDLAKCLTYKGGYVLVDRRMNAHVAPYVRVDWRDAVHEAGTQFVYHSHTTRATVGANYALTSRIRGKIEYTFVRERDVIPEFPDDILTTSIVVATD